MGTYVLSKVPGVVYFPMVDVRGEMPNHESPETTSVLKFPIFDKELLLKTIGKDGWPTDNLTLRGSNYAEIAPRGCFSPHYHGVGTPDRPNLKRSKKNGMIEIFYFSFIKTAHFGVSDGDSEEVFCMPCGSCILVAGGIIHWCTNRLRTPVMYIATMLSYGFGRTVRCV